VENIKRQTNIYVAKWHWILISEKSWFVQSIYRNIY